MRETSLIPYNEVFWRARCPRKGWGREVLAVCLKYAYAHRNFNYPIGYDRCDTEAWLLDGRCTWRSSWCVGLAGAHIVGTKVERLVCYELGIEQPPLRRDETVIPTRNMLIVEVDSQKKAAADGKLKRPLSADELGLGSIYIIGR